jgi:copper chaperone CopZ
MSQEIERTYSVDGMICGHCREAVAREVAAVLGVTAVDVDLDAGVMTVRGDGFEGAAVTAAVVEAGYEVAS